MMQSNSPMSILVGYMGRGANVTTALDMAAREHPDVFTPQQVDVARAVLAKDSAAQQRIVANMARERGLDLNQCMENVQGMARAAGIKLCR